MEQVIFRIARLDDLPTLLALLADDELGQTREAPVGSLAIEYVDAFNAIARDERNELIVAELNGEIVGMLQLTFIPGLTHRGGERAQVEGVRVAAAHRSLGIGRALFEWAIERARERGCRIVQLTTDKRRPHPHRFYASLGFEATHEGMKLTLDR